MSGSLVPRRALRLPPPTNPMASWRTIRRRGSPLASAHALATTSIWAARTPSQSAIRFISTSPYLRDVASPIAPAPSVGVSEKAYHERLYILHGTTAVLPSLSEIFSHDRRTALRYIYHLGRFKFFNFYSHMTHFWSSRIRLFPRPEFKYKPALTRAPGLARDLHAQMNQAIAAGNIQRLGELCTPALAEKYKAAIKLRQSREAERSSQAHLGVTLRHTQSTEEPLVWEAVRYTKPPKLVDRATYAIPSNLAERAVPAYVRIPVISQAVVRISSIQRLARWRRTGLVSHRNSSPSPADNPASDRRGWEMVEGSEKLHTVTEHVVIQRQHDPKTYRPLGEWKVWGTIGPLKWDKIQETLKMDKEHNAKMDNESKEKLALSDAASAAGADAATSGKLSGSGSSAKKKKKGSRSKTR